MPKPQVRELPQELPDEENAFWETIHRWVITSFRTAGVWLPSQWEEAPTQGFKDFLLDQFSFEMRSDEESLHAWSVAVRAIVRHLVHRKDIVMDIVYDYPSCDAAPCLLVRRSGKFLGLISISPSDYVDDYTCDWKELREFLLQVANDVVEIVNRSDRR